MNNVTIQCIHINKSFAHNGNEPLLVLKNIDFIANKGEMIMLKGPSGSGKTTLLAIIGGILKPTSGECIILDKALSKLNPTELANLRGDKVGYLFQKFMLVPTLNALENAAVPLLCKGVPYEQAYKIAAELLEKVGLHHQLYANSQQLSGGEQQRVALARAMIHNPQILLCDEPTSYLDSERGQQIMELLKAMQKEHHTTIIVVTHDDRILPFADRVVEIEDGIIKNSAGEHTAIMVRLS